MVGATDLLTSENDAPPTFIHKKVQKRLGKAGLGGKVGSILTARRSAAAVFGAFALAASVSGAWADEPVVGNVYVLGDSLSDGGAYTTAANDDLTDQGPPASFLAGAVPGWRFTNNKPDGSAQTYAEAFAALNGQTLGIYEDTGSEDDAAVIVGGSNFAQGGARVTEDFGLATDIAEGYFTRSVTWQVDQLLAMKSGGFAANDVVLIQGGANDVFFQLFQVSGGGATPTQAGQALLGTGGELAALIHRLEGAGAKNIIVATVPDIGGTPFAADLDQQAISTFINDNINPALVDDATTRATVAGQLAGAGALPSQGATGLAGALNTGLRIGLDGSRAVLLDSDRLFDAMAADPASFGFTAALEPQDHTLAGLEGIACEGGPPGAGGAENSLVCLDGVNNPDADPNGVFIFADGVHPTVEAHAIFAQVIQATFVGANDQARMLESILQASRSNDLWREARLRPTAFSVVTPDGLLRRPEGDIRGRIVGAFESNEGDEIGLFGGTSGDSASVRLAADFMLGAETLLGFELGYNDGETDGVITDAEWSGFQIGAYGLMQFGEHFHVNLAGGVELLDFDSIERSVTLGPRTETYAGETSGYRAYGRVGLGATVDLGGGFALTPDVALTRQELVIDTYTESDGAGSLSFGDNRISSLRAIGGVTLSAAPVSLPGWAFALRGSYEEELEDERHDVEVGSFASHLGALSIERVDDSYGQVDGRITKDLGGVGAVSVFGGITAPQEGDSAYTAGVELGVGF